MGTASVILLIAGGIALYALSLRWQRADERQAEDRARREAEETARSRREGESP